MSIVDLSPASLSAFIVLGLLVLGGVTLWAMSSFQDSQETIWSEAARNLGLRAEVLSPRCPYLRGTLPEGKIDMYSKTSPRRAREAKTQIELSAKLPSGLALESRGMLGFGSSPATTGDPKFDSAFGTNGRPELLLAILSDSAREALMRVTEVNAGTVSLKIADGRILCTIWSARLKSAQEVEALVGSVRGVARALLDRTELSPVEGLLANVSDARRFEVRTRSLEAMASCYPERLPDALAIAERDGVAKVRLAAARLMGPTGVPIALDVLVQGGEASMLDAAATLCDIASDEELARLLAEGPRLPEAALLRLRSRLGRTSHGSLSLVQPNDADGALSPTEDAGGLSAADVTSRESGELAD